MDFFVFDYAYAAIAPAPAFNARDVAANASSLQALSPWTYKSSTFLFELEPSRYAYMSSLPRNNVFRQYISLFLITWYATLSVYVVAQPNQY